MAKILPESLDQIRKAADIFDVASTVLPDLKKSGETAKAKSPITNEKTASLTLFLKTNTFVDYSAGGDHKGDVIKFVMLYRRLSFLDAVEWLADRYRVQLNFEKGPRRTIQEKEEISEGMHRVLNWSLTFFRDNLNSAAGEMAFDYLVAKGFNEETIKKFSLGYAVDSFNHILKAGHAAGFTTDDLFQVGLVNTKHDAKDKKKAYDTFRHRIMFPYFNDKGDVCGYTARLLTQSKTNFKDSPKYINTKETKVFQKGSLLYGMGLAKEAVRSRDMAIIMEGPTDVLAMHQAGFTHAVCGSGTAFTQKHLFILRRYTVNFLTLFDGDGPGLKATSNAIDILLSGGGNVEVGIVPDGLDPQELLMTRGVEAMQKVIDDKVNFIEYKALEIKANGDNPVKKARAIARLVRTICFVQLPELRHTYLELCEKVTGVPYAILKESEQKFIQKATAHVEELVSSIRSRLVLSEEQEVLRMILRNSRTILDSGINFTDFILNCIDEAELYFTATEDNYLFNIISVMRLHNHNVDMETIHETDGRAFAHASRILGVEKYTALELKLRDRQNPAVAMVLMTGTLQLIDRHISLAAKRLETETGEANISLLKQRMNNLKSLSRENNAFIRKQAV